MKKLRFMMWFHNPFKVFCSYYDRTNCEWCCTRINLVIYLWGRLKGEIAPIDTDEYRQNYDVLRIPRKNIIIED